MTSAMEILTCRPALRLARPVHLFSLLVLAFALVSVPTEAATISITNADNPGEGFNDPTPRSPVTGNSGTTLGQQRLNAFAAAAAYWANRLSSPAVITVYAQMNPLACSPSSGTLGSAGSTNAFGNFTNAPRANTWYTSALANALYGSTLDPSTPDITAQFNSSIGVDPGCLTGMDWWYGSAGSAPASTFPFFNTVAHELAHGLGMASLVDLDTGAELLGFDDIYTFFLEDHSTGETWPQMSNAERFASARDPGDLHWTGPLVLAAGAGLSAGRHPSGHVQMFAPTPAQPGSSVSHWDSDLFPDEMMEPFATASPNDIVTTALLKDLGWPTPQTGVCIPSSTTACLLSGRFKVEVDWTTATETGAAQVMSFGGQRAESDESVFFWFFGPENFEMGVKMVDACVAPYNHYWAFVSGLTNQAYTVTITRASNPLDVTTYSNPINTLPTTVADTSAFTCP